MSPILQKRGRFPSEPPTLSNKPAARAAKLVADWNACSPSFQKWLERQAAKGAALPKSPQPWPQPQKAKRPVKKLAIETVVPALVGLALCGYIAFRCGRGAWRALQQAFIDFVSG